ncbi:unnamed protein product [Prunus armeniaca]|uniref:Uncharacterized protein n=1 Tax=Prunus armeniaca TaxID=36596 RepID=A0A6J5Y8K3_PRUAR|nr:unnamed protein product [Prunus armeniaca]
MVRIVKVLTRTDVSQRLGVTTEMLNMLPPYNREHDVPVRVLDDTGMIYEFKLSVRAEGALKLFSNTKNGEPLSIAETLELGTSSISGSRKVWIIELNIEFTRLELCVEV